MAKKENNVEGLQDLKQHLKEKNPHRLYFFFGEEMFLLRYYLNKMQSMIVDPLTESFNFHKLTGETFTVHEFADCVENLPMMAERTMVLVDDVDPFGFPEPERNKLMEVFSDIPDYCTVIFSYETVTWKPDKRYKKLYEAVAENGLQVEFCKQEQRDLIPWIGRHFAANGKRITPKLCSYLIDITDGTMTSLAGEISKICSYSGAEEISQSDIDAVTEPVLDAVVFQMSDLLGQGEYGGALLKLRQLRKMQQEPLAILGVIGGHFRRMSTSKALLSGKRPAAELALLYHISEYMAKRTMDASSRFSDAFYKSAAQLILETDYRLKTSFDDPDRLLELLILELAREARNG